MNPTRIYNSPTFPTTIEWKHFRCCQAEWKLCRVLGSRPFGIFQNESAKSIASIPEAQTEPKRIPDEASRISESVFAILKKVPLKKVLPPMHYFHFISRNHMFQVVACNASLKQRNSYCSRTKGEMASYPMPTWTYSYHALWRHGGQN